MKGMIAWRVTGTYPLLTGSQTYSEMRHLAPPTLREERGHAKAEEHCARRLGNHGKLQQVPANPLRLLV